MAQDPSSSDSAQYISAPPTEQVTDEGRERRLALIQREALGTERRDYLSTHDFSSHTSKTRLSPRDIERHRRVNQRGTQESAVSSNIKEKLTGWNNAWTHLNDDDTHEHGLEDLNAGQSHRQRLLSELPLQPPLDGLEEARRFASEVRGATRSRDGGRGGHGGRGGGAVGRTSNRIAQRRVPPGGEPTTQRQSQNKQWPQAPERPKFSFKFPTAANNTGTVAAKSSRPLRTKLESQQLVLPAEYMTRVMASTVSTLEAQAASTPKAPATNQSTSVAAKSQMPLEAPQPEEIPEKPVVPSAAAPIEDLLDSSEKTEALPAKSYADDLLDIEVSQSSNLPAPMQASTKIIKNEPYSGASPAHVDLRELDSQLAYFLPILESVLEPDIAEKLTAVRFRLQQKMIDKDALQAGPNIDKAVQSSEGLANQRRLTAPNHAPSVPAVGSKNNVAATSLAFNTEERTQKWSQKKISSTASTKHSILGEHISRSTWTRCRNSIGSVTSISGLEEGIQKLRIDENAPSVAPDDPKQYANVNPFSSFHRDASPPLPATAYQAVGHGAAARAQYLGSTLAPMKEPLQSPIATVGARENEMQPVRKASLVQKHALSNPAGPPHANDDRNVRKDSVSSTSSVISPSLGEDVIRNPRPDFTNRYPRTTAGPRPAAFLANVAQPAGDPGAAARAQYGQGAAIPTPFHQQPRAPSRTQSMLSGASTERTPMHPTPHDNKGSIIGEVNTKSSRSTPRATSSNMSRYVSGANIPQFSKNIKPPPPLPNWFPKGEAPAADPAAAARLQYGGDENKRS
ncbi:MAG: hypothetical protein Q9170_004128 [Blastenia crenularia]